MKKLINRALYEAPVLGLGSGLALFGASVAVIGFQVVRKNLPAGAVAMGIGAISTHIGTQVAIGSVERIRGLR